MLLTANEFLARATAFQQEMAERRSREPAPPPGWYPYDAISTLLHLTRFTRFESDVLAELSPGDEVLDLACADGESSLFLERLGLKVTAVDWSPVNYNRLQAARLLLGDFQSSVRLLDEDVNESALPFDRPYRLTLCLGLFYHLKNPLGVLEKITRCTDLLLFNTRVARHFGGTSLSAEPMAYLVARDEMNSDSSNYWIFTPAGVDRALNRAFWKPKERFFLGAEQSDVTSADERMFVLAASEMPKLKLTCGAGWYDAEDGGWRWTASQFSLLATGLSEWRAFEVGLHVFRPEHPFDIHVTAECGSEERSAIYRPGLPARLSFAFPAPPSDAAEIRFTVCPGMENGGQDRRDLGIVVTQIEARPAGS